MNPSGKVDALKRTTFASSLRDILCRSELLQAKTVSVFRNTIVYGTIIILISICVVHSKQICKASRMSPMIMEEKGNFLASNVENYLMWR